MQISKGFNDKPLNISFSVDDNAAYAHLDINQEGLEDLTPHQKSETLSYISLEELINLRDEINDVIRRIVRI